MTAPHLDCERAALLANRTEHLGAQPAQELIAKEGAEDVGRGEANPQKFTDAPEKDLHVAFTAARGKVTQAVKADDYALALREITQLKPAVDTFFDKVMVMAEDKELRENRIRLLTEIGALFNQVADFSKIQAEVAAAA